MPSEPHITAADLRTALGSSRQPRRTTGVLPGAPDPTDWDWGADSGEVAELRATVARQREELERLETQLEAAQRAERATADALRKLAQAPFGRRRRTLAELRSTGLLD